MNLEPSFIEMTLTKLALIFAGESVYKEFADNIPLFGTEKVLDFGSGMGTIALFVLPRLSDGYLTCYDVSERWLNACRKTLSGFSNVLFHKGQSNILGLKDDIFDVIYCHYVLHDIPDDDLGKIFCDLVRSLKQGGVLVFREPLIDKEKLNRVKMLAHENGLSMKESRITDVPFMGNALESKYIKI